MEAARAELRSTRAGDIEITYVSSWFDHPGFIGTNAAHVAAALETLPPDVVGQARIVFTAHSIPVSMAERSQYREQLHHASKAVAERLGNDWVLVYQSRSGRPEDPWLGPDICDYLKTAHAAGLRAAVICPIGFVCDHIEVLYDLDREAADIAREVGLPMTRADAVNDDPLFLDMMADMVLRRLKRPTLPIVAG